MPDFSAALAVAGVVGGILGLIIGFATGALVLWIISGVVACLGRRSRCSSPGARTDGPAVKRGIIPMPHAEWGLY